jgi:RNA polymerase sigma-54 factor
MEDVPIARHIIGNLDDRGWLSCDVEDAASALGVELERVEAVLTVVQSLEPVGIAARNARECLLIQIADLRREGYSSQGSEARSMAEHLIRDHWDSLGRSSPQSLARAACVSADQVRSGLRFIRKNLNPFPAHAGWSDARRAPSETGAGCPQPDVIIREDETAVGGYEIELPKAGAYGLRVSASYARAMEDVREGESSGEDGSGGVEGWELWQKLCGRARLFVKSVEQRWETLHALMRCLVDYQRDFLVDGERSLKPLTRAEIAEIMGVHESTVSRAVAGKYVELPCGEVVSLETFFDSTAPIKRRIEELVAEEEVPLSDRAIAERLGEQGYPVARRTVAKYRNALNILPSSLRRWSRGL